jgi:hypothetical protein
MSSMVDPRGQCLQVVAVNALVMKETVCPVHFMPVELDLLIGWERRFSVTTSLTVKPIPIFAPLLPPRWCQKVLGKPDTAICLP